jgi:hypothetical protein
MDRWEASRGDPRPAQSISDSSESGFEKGGDLVYNDFGINLKNGRRQVVSMVSVSNAFILFAHTLAQQPSQLGIPRPGGR